MPKPNDSARDDFVPPQNLIDEWTEEASWEIPRWLMRRQDMTTSQKILWAYLYQRWSEEAGLFYTGPTSGEFDKVSTARDLGLSNTEIAERLFGSLVECGFVFVDANSTSFLIDPRSIAEGGSVGE